MLSIAQIERRQQVEKKIRQMAADARVSLKEFKNFCESQITLDQDINLDATSSNGNTALIWTAVMSPKEINQINKAGWLMQVGNNYTIRNKDGKSFKDFATGEMARLYQDICVTTTSLIRLPQLLQDLYTRFGDFIRGGIRRENINICIVGTGGIRTGKTTFFSPFLTEIICIAPGTNITVIEINPKLCQAIRRLKFIARVSDQHEKMRQKTMEIPGGETSWAGFNPTFEALQKSLRTLEAFGEPPFSPDEARLMETLNRMEVLETDVTELNPKARRMINKFHFVIATNLFQHIDDALKIKTFALLSQCLDDRGTLYADNFPECCLRTSMKDPLKSTLAKIATPAWETDLQAAESDERTTFHFIRPRLSNILPVWSLSKGEIKPEILPETLKQTCPDELEARMCNPR